MTGKFDSFWRRMIRICASLGLVLALNASPNPASAQSPPPDRAALLKEVHDEFLFLKDIPAQRLTAGDVKDILPGKWAVMDYDGLSGWDEGAYQGAILQFCTRKAWLLDKTSGGWAGTLGKDVPVTIQAQADANYTIDVDPDRYLASLGVDPGDKIMSAGLRQASAPFVHRQAYFFRYSDNALIELASPMSPVRLWRRCPAGM